MAERPSTHSFSIAAEVSVMVEVEVMAAAGRWWVCWRSVELERWVPKARMAQRSKVLVFAAARRVLTRPVVCLANQIASRSFETFLTSFLFFFYV